MLPLAATELQLRPQHDYDSARDAETLDRVANVAKLVLVRPQTANGASPYVSRARQLSQRQRCGRSGALPAGQEDVKTPSALAERAKQPSLSDADAAGNLTPMFLGMRAFRVYIGTLCQ